MKSRWEHWRKNVTGKRPFRCRACKWRGWAVDPGLTFTEAEIERATRAIAPEPPNLKGTALGTKPLAPEIDLKALDTIDAAEITPTGQTAAAPSNQTRNIPAAANDRKIVLDTHLN